MNLASTNIKIKVIDFFISDKPSQDLILHKWILKTNCYFFLLLQHYSNGIPNMANSKTLIYLLFPFLSFDSSFCKEKLRFFHLCNLNKIKEKINVLRLWTLFCLDLLRLICQRHSWWVFLLVMLSIYFISLI